MRVWNPTEEKVNTQIQGSWFSFQPGQFKNMDESKADFIRMNRKGTGLVVLPPQFDPFSDQFIENYEKTEEGKQVLLDKKEEGIRGLIEFHMEIVKNNQVSLRNDLAIKSPAADHVKLAALNASAGEIESMRLVAKYKGKASDSAAKKVDAIESLMDQIGPVTV